MAYDAEAGNLWKINNMYSVKIAILYMSYYSEKSK